MMADNYRQEMFFLNYKDIGQLHSLHFNSRFGCIMKRVDKIDCSIYRMSVATKSHRAVTTEKSGHEQLVQASSPYF